MQNTWFDKLKYVYHFTLLNLISAWRQMILNTLLQIYKEHTREHLKKTFAQVVC